MAILICAHGITILTNREASELVAHGRAHFLCPQGWHRVSLYYKKIVALKNIFRRIAQASHILTIDVDADEWESVFDCYW
jgi:hypothetical protein